MAEHLVDRGEPAALVRFEQYGFLTREGIRAVQEYARVKQAVPFLAQLINYENERFGHEVSKMEL